MIVSVMGSARRWSARLLLALGILLAGLGLSTSVASAEDVAIRIQVKEQNRDESGKVDNQPVAGVEVVVLDADGTEVGRGVTGEDGVVVVAVPARAD